MPSKQHHNKTNGTNGSNISYPNETNGTNTNGLGLEEYKRVNEVADYLVEQFRAPNSRRFYCKVAYSLPFDKIRTLVSIAKADAKKSPGGYFNVLARKEMGDIR